MSKKNRNQTTSNSYSKKESFSPFGDIFRVLDNTGDNATSKENQIRTEEKSTDEEVEVAGEDEDDEFVRNGLERRTNYDENDDEKCSAQEYETMKVRR